jgi:uncharacterized membrane protein
MTDTHPVPRDTALRAITTTLYALFVIGGLTAIAGIILNHLRKDSVKGTLYESHFRWQMRTFWYALLWMFLSGFLILIAIGYVLIFAVFIWYLVRMIKGWLCLVEGKPMYQ